MHFAPHVRTTDHPFYASAGTFTITPNNSEDSKSYYIAHSEWAIIAGSLREIDVGRGHFCLLYNGDYLKVGQRSDLETGEISMCQELWTPIPMWETETEHNALSMPYLLVASIKSGKGKGLMVRLGDYCQGVAQLDAFGLHVERWKRVTDDRGSRRWIKTHQSTTWVKQEENLFLPGEWLCGDERRLGHGIITCPSSVRTIWYVIEESWLQQVAH